MKILFITSSRLGDAVLSTGILDHLLRTHPGAEVTIACGPLASSLFEGVPGVRRIISLKKQKHNGHWLKLWRSVVKTRWDIVVDLRNSIVSRAVLAKKRYIYTARIDKNMHKTAQNSAVLRLSETPSPRIWISPAQAQAAAALIPPGAPVLAIGPTANWIGKTWPAERFIELTKALIAPASDFDGWRIAVFAAPGEEDAALQLLNSLPEERRLNLIAKTDPGTAAACLAACSFYIGNDSGLMHTAAAAGVPTLGLFGPSWPHIYAPWGDHTAYIATAKNFAQLTDFPGYTPGSLKHSLMESLSVEDVLAAARALKKKTAL